ncbi:MAG: phage terminase large subunit [Patescibacteria group bacterium]
METKIPTKKFKFRNHDTGEILKEFDLSLKQHRFIKDEEHRYSLYSGGFGAGKTLALELKILYLALKYPKNTILVGRQHYQDLRDTVQKEFFELCPEQYISTYVKSERKVVLTNGSEILFRHLDKVSEKEVRSLNLGAFAIDQMEDIAEPVYLALKGRLRKNGTSQQGFGTSNPAPSWIFREFKQQQKEENLLIETSTLENPHLSKEYIADLLKYPEYWKKQFVYGEWDTAIMGDRNVYHLQITDAQNQNLILPENAFKFEDVRIYKTKFEEGDYLQMGVDISEGIGGDASVLSVVNTKDGEEIAFWQGQLPPDILVEKALRLTAYLNNLTKNRLLVVPEVNGLGIAFLTHIKKSYHQIYKREVFLKMSRERKEVLGWKTSTSTKPLLINNHVDLLRNNHLVIHTPEILEQMKTFVYTDDTKKSGMGADPGFHDDAVIGHALACFFSAPTKMRLLSSNKSNTRSPLAKAAYNPRGESISSLFAKPHYDWMTDSNTYEDN